MCTVFVLLLALVLFLPDCQAECPPGATIAHNGTTQMCLNFTETKATWPEARRACIEQGGYLVMILNEYEETIIWEVARGHKVWIGLTDQGPGGAGGNGLPWDGGSSGFGEGYWRWDHTNLTLTVNDTNNDGILNGKDDWYPYAHWKDTQPNSNGDQDCAWANMIEPLHSHYWDDGNCISENTYMCQFTFSNVPTSAPSAQPTSQPSVPTSVPTSQPTQPTGQPSSQPSALPTGIPSGQPTTQPSVPTSNPTSSVPTSSPTIFCPAGSYFDYETVSCLPCPRGTSTRGIAGLIGYAGNCLACPAGSYNPTPGAAKCALCPLGTFSSVEGRAIECDLCERATYASRLGQTFCIACISGRTTPGIGSDRESLCVNPATNFMFAALTIPLVIALSWEYIFRGRFRVVAFLRRQRVSKPIILSAKQLAPYVYRFVYRSEAQRVYQTGNTFIRVIAFVVAGSALASLVTLAYLSLALSTLAFKGMIVAAGLRMSEVPFIMKFNKFAMNVMDTLMVPWVYHVFIYPFTVVIGFLANLQVDLAWVELTCAGATSPFKLMGNLTILGIVVVLVESEFALFKAVSADTLTDKFFEIVTSVSYRIWTPKHFSRQEYLRTRTSPAGWRERYFNENPFLIVPKLFSFRFFSTLGTTLSITIIGSSNFFVTALQYLASRAEFGDFTKNKGFHAWDEDCNVMNGFPMFDTIIAISASLIAYLLLLPVIYEVSGVFIPGMPPSVPFIQKDLKKRDRIKIHDTWLTLWKYSSLVAPDLWWADGVERWFQYMRQNTPYTTGPRAPSLSQAEKLAEDEDLTKRDIMRYKDLIEANKRMLPFIDGKDRNFNKLGLRARGERKAFVESEKGSLIQPKEEELEIEGAESSEHVYGIDSFEEGGHIAALLHNSAQIEAMKVVEEPPFFTFRAIVRYVPSAESEDSSEAKFQRKEMHIFRFFTAKRKINKTNVWTEILCECSNSSGNTTLIVIDSDTGEIKRNRTYAAWDINDAEATRELVDDLGGVNVGEVLLLVKWGDRANPVVDLVERSFLQACTRQELLPDSVLDSHRTDGMRDSSALSLSQKDKLEFFDTLKGISTKESQTLMEFASKVAWSGGDASNMAMTRAFALISTPLSENSFGGYQRWVDFRHRVFEGMGSRKSDITWRTSSSLEEPVALEDGALSEDLLDLTFEVSRTAFGSTQNVIEDSSLGYGGFLGLPRDSYVLSMIRSRTEKESQAWSRRKVRGLPPYLALCHLEIEELSRRDIDYSTDEASGFCQCCVSAAKYLAMRFRRKTLWVLAVMGLLHPFTEVGRRAYYVVFWKYFRFLGLCFGVWTTDIYEMFNVRQVLRETSLAWMYPDDDLTDEKLHIRSSMARGTKKEVERQEYADKRSVDLFLNKSDEEIQKVVEELRLEKSSKNEVEEVSSGNVDSEDVSDTECAPDDNTKETTRKEQAEVEEVSSGNVDSEDVSDTECTPDDNTKETTRKEQAEDEEEYRDWVDEVEYWYTEKVLPLVSPLIWHTEESEDAVKLGTRRKKLILQEDYTNSLNAFVAPRAAVLQVIPGLTMLSIFADLTSKYPLFVMSKELEISLPELMVRNPFSLAREAEEEWTNNVNKVRQEEMNIHDHNLSTRKVGDRSMEYSQKTKAAIKSENERMEKKIEKSMTQPALKVKSWVVFIEGIDLLLDSRIIGFVFHLTIFCFILAVVFADNQKGTVEKPSFLAAFLVLTIPYCVAKSIKVYVLVGKILAVTDEDLAFVRDTVRAWVGLVIDTITTYTQAVIGFISTLCNSPTKPPSFPSHDEDEEGEKIEMIGGTLHSDSGVEFTGDDPTGDRESGRQISMSSIYISKEESGATLTSNPLKRS